MDDIFYKVPREDIYVGKVVAAYRLVRNASDKPHFKVKPGEVEAKIYTPYRSMLFVVSENKRASDLLYGSPEYPILNITDESEIVKLRVGSTIVTEAFSLASLLKYFDYDYKISYAEMNRIRNRFFDGNFTSENWNLFTATDKGPDYFKIDTDTIRVKNPFLRKRLILQKIKQVDPQFFESNKTKLPVEIWDCLNEMGDYGSFRFIDGDVESNADAFEPAKEEGEIKKLSLFY